MKYKIKYFLTGGENINYFNKYIGSYTPTIFKTDDSRVDIEYFSVNPDENFSTKEYFYKINNSTVLTTMINDGSLTKKRYMNKETRKYSNQCMYISIYDYLILKKLINISFSLFRTFNNIKTLDYQEWDSSIYGHEDNIIRLCNKYNLDIRIWYKTEHKNLSTNTSHWQYIINEHNGKYLIAPMIRYGTGNQNIVNIAYIDAPRHFELILGGSFFEPLLTKEEFYALPIEYAKFISNKKHTTYRNTSFSTSLRDTDAIIRNYGQNKNIITFFNDLIAKDQLYRDYFCNHKDKIENQDPEPQEQEQELEQQKQQEQEQQEKEPLEKQQQEQQQQLPEQEDDDFFNYENKDIIEKFESYYCDNQVYDGDKYEFDYEEEEDAWREWKGDYCDSDNDKSYWNMKDWDDDEVQQPQYLNFLDEYFEYYNNN
jgi:hypothetical protein